MISVHMSCPLLFFAVRPSSLSAFLFSLAATSATTAASLAVLAR